MVAGRHDEELEDIRFRTERDLAFVENPDFKGIQFKVSQSHVFLDINFTFNIVV
jgi:hypothetical protein